MRALTDPPYCLPLLVGLAVASLVRLGLTYWRRLGMHWRVQTQGSKIIYRRGGSQITFENYTQAECERIMDTWFPGKVNHEEQV